MPVSSYFEDFQQRLGYRFKEPELLRLAFTHASFGHEKRMRLPDNQRLEFLGDAVLQLAITTELYQRLPEAPEGRLTALRARLVNRTQLRELAHRLGVGEHLILGRGEENSRGRERASILADGMEAVFGAVYQEAGWEITQKLILTLLDAALTEVCSSSDEEETNPKGRLQEKLQAEGDQPPIYRCVAESGPAHARIYEIVVEWQGQELGRGTGNSKKEAEIHAAQAALERNEKASN